jgi:hypothetical protein
LKAGRDDEKVMPFRRLANYLLANRVIKTVLRRVHDLYAWLWSFATNRLQVGTNVYDKEWDLLVLLDCCRVDALKAVADEYDFIHDVDSMVSVGSTSREWISKTFTSDRLDDVQRTAYVTGNVYPRTVFEWGRYEYPHREGAGNYRRAHMSHVGFDVVNASDFELLDMVWQYAPDEQTDFSKVRPDFLTDRAISVARERNPERLIVHYMYPHGPYVGNAVRESRELLEYEENPMMALRNGTTSRDAVWEAYLDELRYVLDSVEVLLENVDAERVAISADHGEGFGEWGLYAHLLGSPSPYVKKVPWAETTARDTGTYEPTATRPEMEPADDDVEDRLEALGYR